MFWDNVAWLYDIFADGINRKANRALCAAVGELISPADDVLECACGTGLLTTVIAPRWTSRTGRCRNWSGSAAPAAGSSSPPT